MSHSYTDLDDQTLRHLIEALTESGQAISIYDSEDRLRFANKTYRGMFLQGYDGCFTFAEILRHGARTGTGVKIDGGDVEALIARTYTRRRTVPRKSFEVDLVDGRWFWMDQTILPNGWILSVGADITTLKHNEKSLRRAHEEALLASRTDLLTGLPNRRRILELLDEALAAAKVEGRGFCIAIIDLDRFKAVNDTYGHEAGDAVLQHFAGACLERLREQDKLGRTGGEEFLLLLPDVRISDAACLIEGISKDLPAARIKDSAAEVLLTFSAGVTEALPHDDRSSILYRADRALYAAKGAGRNCIKIGFAMDARTPEMNS